MKCKSLFSGKNKKSINNLSSADLAQRLEKVKSDYDISKRQVSIYISCDIVRKLTLSQQF